LYQTKKGFPVFFGSLRSRNSTTLVELSSSTVLERSSVSGRRGAEPQVGRAARESRRYHAGAQGNMPVKKALRPEAQLCVAT
jgi:hypothetical protein